MDKDIQYALEDIGVIKKSIGESKNNIDIIRRLFMVFGVINLLQFLLITIAAMFFNQRIYTRISFLVFILSSITFIIFFVYYVNLYKKEKNNSNKYYNGFLGAFAGVAFVFPLLTYIMQIISSYINQNNNALQADMHLLIIQMEHLVNIVFVCFSITIIGYILKKRSPIYISIIVIIIYLGIDLFYSNVVILKGLSLASLTLNRIYYDMVISLGYIIMALILKREDKLNGDKLNGSK